MGLPAALKTELVASMSAFTKPAHTNTFTIDALSDLQKPIYDSDNIKKSNLIEKLVVKYKTLPKTPTEIIEQEMPNLKTFQHHGALC